MVLTECERLVPVWGTTPCPRLSKPECLMHNWTGVTPSRPGNPACFGHFEDIANCPSCNILSISNYTSCQNKQYIDCLLDGHLADRTGNLCFVTRLSEIRLSTPVRVTARELCYYTQVTGTLPPECSSQCGASLARAAALRVAFLGPALAVPLLNRELARRWWACPQA
jgi:hypothetical protein